MKKNHCMLASRRKNTMYNDNGSVETCNYKDGEGKFNFYTLEVLFIGNKREKRMTDDLMIPIVCVIFFFINQFWVIIWFSAD